MFEIDFDFGADISAIPMILKLPEILEIAPTL